MQLAEACDWLELAVEGKEEKAFIPLAQIYERGIEGHKNRAKALEVLRALVDMKSTPDYKHQLAAAYLRCGQEHQKQEALKILESCSKQGFYRSTDLWAQCLATGVGTSIKESEAYSLFALAWKQSKEAGEKYFSASNNLGVCLAIGFGTPKDSENAKIYFHQGAIANHDASKKNLEKLNSEVSRVPVF